MSRFRHGRRERRRRHGSRRAGAISFFVSPCQASSGGNAIVRHDGVDRARLIRTLLGYATFGHADSTEGAGAIGFRAHEDDAGAQHEQKECSHGHLRSHRIAARPRNRAPDALGPGQIAVSFARGLQDARLESDRRLDQGQNSNLARRTKSGQRRLAVFATVRVPFGRRERELVELVVDGVDDDLVELLAVHVVLSAALARTPRIP